MGTGDLRGTADSQDVKLRLVQTHVTQGESSKETRQEDEHGNEDRKDDELGIVRFRLPLHEQVDVFRSGLAREPSELA